MSKKVKLAYKNLQESIFVERPNRFILLCRLLGDGNVIEAHLPDPGRLKELLIPGVKIWLSPADNPSRRTVWSAVLCQSTDLRGYVSLDSTLPNRLIKKALEYEAIEEFKGWNLERVEYKMEHSRWDFLMSGTGGQRLIIEVKSVTLVQDGVGLFPDAITARGTRHVRELSAINQMKAWKTAILFVVQRDDAKEVHAADWIDYKFATALKEARELGVKIVGRKCQVNPQEIVLGSSIPVK